MDFLNHTQTSPSQIHCFIMLSSIHSPKTYLEGEKHEFLAERQFNGAWGFLLIILPPASYFSERKNKSENKRKEIHTWGYCLIKNVLEAVWIKFRIWTKHWTEESTKETKRLQIKLASLRVKRRQIQCSYLFILPLYCLYRSIKSFFSESDPL